MKKSFLNILSKRQKRNGFSMLACAVILTVCLETLAGCSAANGKKDSETILSYIKSFDGENISFDAVEWVDVPSERATELGITEDDEPSGFCIYNEDTTLSELPLSKDCVCNLLNWSLKGGTYEPVVVQAEKLSAVFEERKEVNDSIPYHLTIQDGKIIEITEHYVP